MVVINKAASPDYVLFNGSQQSEISKRSAQDPKNEYYKYFEFTVLVTHLVGVIFLTLDGNFISYAQKSLAYFFGTLISGFTWKTAPEILADTDTKGSKGLYNFHGFFMTSAFVFFQGEG